MKRLLKKYTLSSKGILLWANMIKTTQKIFAIVLLVATLFSALTQNLVIIRASDERIEMPVDETEEIKKEHLATTDPSFDPASVSISHEVLDQRTATTKTFQKIDGTYEVAIYDEVVHYLKNGVYEEIDNRLVSNVTQDGIQNNREDFQVYFPNTLQENENITLKSHAHTISWEVVNALWTHLEKTSVGKMEAQMNELSLLHQSDGVVYRNAFPYVDIEYIVKGSSIKENIILTTYLESYDIQFKYDIGSLSYEILDYNQIGLYDQEENLVFLFDPLYMIDDLGNISYDVSYEIEETLKNGFKIKINPNQEWLKKATFPVVIDPTVSIPNVETIHDTYINGNLSNQIFYSAPSMHINQYMQRGLINFKLPSILTGKIINYAHLTIHSEQSNMNEQINLHENLTVANLAQVNWHSAPRHSDQVVDYRILNYSMSPMEHRFDITKSVRKWHDQGLSDVPGFSILTKEDRLGFLTIHSNESSTGSKRPSIVIGFDDPKGLKHYWTYNTQDIGTAGTSYVSDYTGYSTFIRTDLLFETEKQSLGLSMIYNVLDKDTNIGYGYGFKTNYHYQLLLEDSYYILDPTGDKVKYIDLPDYEDERFVPVLNDKTFDFYLAEDGSGQLLVMEYNGQGAVTSRKLYDRNGYFSTFDQYGRLIKITDDHTDLSLQITYTTTTGNRIQNITDSSNNRIRFTYLAGGNISNAYLEIRQPSGIYNTSERVYYTIGATRHTIRYYAKYNLSYMTLVETHVYDFDDLRRLTAITHNDGEKYQYTYTNHHQVSTINQTVNGRSFGSISYTYSYQQTKITDYRGDYVIYTFDYYGHTINIMDSYGTVLSYEYLNIFSKFRVTGELIDLINTTPNYSQNHAVLSQSNPQKTAINPINNHSFEYEAMYEEPRWNIVGDLGTYPYNFTYVNTTEQNVFGSKSALLQTMNGGKFHIKQSVLLDAGAYTLSGYVMNKTNSNQVYISVSGHAYGGAYQNIPNDGNWHYTEITFGLYQKQEIEIKLYNHGLGKAYFDSIQIVDGFGDTRKNMITNASFEHANVNGSMNQWTFSDGNVMRYAHHMENLEQPYQKALGNHGIKIEGVSTQKSYAMYRYLLAYDQIEESGTLVVGGWAKSEGTPSIQTTTDPLGSRYFRIRVDMLSSGQYGYGSQGYQNHLLDSQYVDFDTQVESWQYLLKQMPLHEDAVVIYLFLEYQGEGDVYFDSIQMYFEGMGTRYYYDDFGRVSTYTNSSGSDTNITYENDYSNDPSQITSLSTDSQITYDASGNVSSFVVNNVRLTPGFNSNGQVTSIRIGQDNHFYTTYTSYLSSGFLQYIYQKTDEFGQKITFSYNLLNGLLTAIEDAKGRDVHYIYNNKGQLIEVVEVENHQSYTENDIYIRAEYLYDAKNRLSKIVLDSDLYYELIYDSQNRISQIKVNNTALMTYSYQMDDGTYTYQLGSQTYANNDQMQFIYNDEGQLIDIQFKGSGDPDFESRFTYVYDQSGKVSVINTLVDGQLIFSEYFTYDLSGRLKSISTSDGNSITYAYDQEGNLSNFDFEVNGESRSINYFYNKDLYFGEGNPVNTQSNFYDRTIYDITSNQTVQKIYNYQANALYRLDYIDLTADGKTVKQTFSYVLNTTRIRSITYSYSHKGDTFRYQYSYDANGNITSISYFENEVLKNKDDYAYDAIGQLMIEDTFQSGGNCGVGSNTCYTNIYEYDQLGNLLEIRTYKYGDRDFKPIVMPPFQYLDGSSEPVLMFYNDEQTYQDIYEINVGQSPSLSFYYMDADMTTLISGIMTTMTSSNLNIHVPGYYESFYRATSPFGVNIRFKVIIKVGNPQGAPNTPFKTVSYVHDDSWLNQLSSYTEIINGVSSTTSQITYDEMGNPLEITNFKYKEINRTKAVFTWEARKLMGVDIYNGSVIIASIRYLYNDAGYRIQKQTTEGGSTKTIDYTLVDDKVIYETNGTYRIIYTYDVDGTLISFNYDVNIHDGVAGNEYFYIRNQQGDITKILDSEQNIVVEYRYDAYGNVIFKTNHALAEINPYTYRGYRYDAELNFYYLNSRYYSPEMRRFINADGYLGEAGHALSHNIYAYCLNNPVMYLDSTGRSAEWNWSAFWTGAFMVATAVGAIAISVATFGAATPLLMTVIAGITLGAGVLTGINGVATIFEAGTGYNFVRDGAFQGNETAYNWYAGIVEGVAIAGTIALSLWQITGKIKGFTGHGLDSALGHNGVGVSANAMQNATRHPLQVIAQSGGRLKYIGKSAVVVLNQTGKVITTWATSSSGWRYMFAIWLAYESLREN